MNVRSSSMERSEVIGELKQIRDLKSKQQIIEK